MLALLSSFKVKISQLTTQYRLLQLLGLCILGFLLVGMEIKRMEECSVFQLFKELKFHFANTTSILQT